MNKQLKLAIAGLGLAFATSLANAEPTYTVTEEKVIVPHHSTVFTAAYIHYKDDERAMGFGEYLDEVKALNPHLASRDRGVVMKIKIGKKDRGIFE